MNKFQVGDVVVLRSGGPKMTVYGLNDNVVMCEWFRFEDGEAQERVQESFFVSSLGYAI